MKIKIDKNKLYQVIKGFGASAAWWSQVVGGWEHNRDEIAELLYNKEKGIGMTIYRYNVGAGSKEGSYITAPWRDTETFEVARGKYDFNRDKNAVWFMKKAILEGAKDVVFFCNSPQVRITKNNKAHTSNKKNNLDESMYQQFADYIIDIYNHFTVKEKITISYFSPINEPDWGWNKPDQEGNHMSSKEVTKIYDAILKKIDERECDCKLSGPESGYALSTIVYANKMFKNQRLRNHFKTLDYHSYWSKPWMKRILKLYMKVKYPKIKLAMSEWCQMVRGRDITMDAALVLANEVHDDLTILNAISWQFWIAVSRYNHHDGLIYVNPENETYETTKKLYAYGNFTKFVRPGAKRIDVKYNSRKIKVSGFLVDDKVVLVIINNGKEKTIDLRSCELGNVSVYETSDERDLEEVKNGNIELLEIPRKSIITICET